METLYKNVLKKYHVIQAQDNCEINDGNGSRHRFRRRDIISTKLNGNDYVFQIKDKFKTEEKFVEYFGNELAYAESNVTTLVVEKNDDKISIKLFFNFKKRGLLRKYFVRRNKISFITINRKTGNVYVGVNHKEKKNKKLNIIRCNPFNTPQIGSILNEIRNVFNDEHLSTQPNGSLHEYSVIKTLKNIVFDELGIDKSYGIEEGLFLNRASKIGVRVSDNFKVFLTRQYNVLPTAKDYKKVGGNFMDAVMMVNNLKGKKIKRILHSIKQFNVFMYNYVFSLFGEKYMKSKSDDEIVKIFQSSVWYRIQTNQENYDVGVLKNCSNTERDNVWKMVMLICDNIINSTTFVDHLNYYFKLKGYGEEIKWKSHNKETFEAEHEEFSNRISEYTQGTVNRIYDPKIITIVEDPINSFNGGVYYPVILKSSREYINESFIQHNCVRTYQKRESIIISIREGSIDSEERASVEFKLQPKEGNKIIMTQYLGKYNRPLDTKWNFALETVLNRLKRLVPELMNTKLILTTKFNELNYHYEYLGDGMNMAWSSEINGEKKYLTDSDNIGLFEIFP